MSLKLRVLLCPRFPLLKQQPSQTVNACMHYRFLSGLATNVKKKKREAHFFEKVHPWRNEEAFVDTIVKSVIYEDDHVVVLVKPNGVAMAGSMYDDLPLKFRPDDLPNNSILSILPGLKKHFNAELLSEVYSQPRLYSGPVLFAKSEKSYECLKHHFKVMSMQKNPFQKYLLLSIGEPDSVENPVNFPVSRIQVENEMLSIKCTNPSEKAIRKRLLTIPRLEHIVIDTASLGSSQVKVAINEIKINKTKWDALQTYMVHNCMCGVLGDHVYSSRLSTIQNRTVLLNAQQCLPKTQELPDEVVKCLKLNNRTVDHTPLHIHCEQVTFPNLSLHRKSQKNNMITVTAPLPEFFTKSLSLLGLKYDGG